MNSPLLWKYFNSKNNNVLKHYKSIRETLLKMKTTLSCSPLPISPFPFTSWHCLKRVYKELNCQPTSTDAKNVAFPSLYNDFFLSILSQGEKGRGCGSMKMLSLWGLPRRSKCCITSVLLLHKERHALLTRYSHFAIPNIMHFIMSHFFSCWG